MTVDDFNAEVARWIATAKDGRWKRPYTELTYQPMQEVLSYLRANGLSPVAARISRVSISRWRNRLRYL